MPKFVRARPPLDDGEARKIRQLGGARHAPADWIERARIVALSWDGLAVAAIAAETGRHENTVRRWLHRFNAVGLDGLGQVPEPQRSIVLWQFVPQSQLLVGEFRGAHRSEKIQDHRQMVGILVKAERMSGEKERAQYRDQGDDQRCQIEQFRSIHELMVPLRGWEVNAVRRLRSSATTSVRSISSAMRTRRLCPSVTVLPPPA